MLNANHLHLDRFQLTINANHLQYYFLDGVKMSILKKMRTEIFRRLIIVGALSTALVACGKDVDSNYKSAGSQITTTQNSDVKKFSSDPTIPSAPSAQMLPGMSATITTPAYEKSWILLKPRLTRNVPSKTIALQEFRRTLENTKLKLNVKFDNKALPKGLVKLKLLSEGQLIDDQSKTTDGQTETSFNLKLKTPSLSKADLAVGYKISSYDLVTVMNGEEFHYAFIVQAYDQEKPTFIAPRSTECTVYRQPEKATGCLQNRTRSVTEISMSNEVSSGEDVSVEFSGGVDLSISIVALSFGYTKGITKSKSETNAASYTFSSCIECSYMIFRQVVESVRMGDVYYVLADGSLEWVGTTTFHNRQYAYENVSTGSDSKNYSCDLGSSLPTGHTASCGGMLTGLPEE